MLVHARKVKHSEWLNVTVCNIDFWNLMFISNIIFFPFFYWFSKPKLINQCMESEILDKIPRDKKKKIDISYS